MIFLATTILERFHQPAFLIDECGTVRYVNARGCRTLGYAAHEARGLLFAELDVSLPVGEWAYYHRRVLAGQTDRPEEHLFLARGGQVLRMEVEASRHDSDGGSLVLLLAKPCRRRPHAGTHDTEQRLRFLALMENIGGLVARHDREQRVSYASRDLEGRLGVAPGVLAGTCLELDACEWCRPLRQAVASVLHTGERREVILDAQLAEGQFTDTVYVVPLRNARGEIEGSLSYAETVAERLLREATIHSTAEPFREIFQNAPDGLFLLEAGDEGRFLVVDVNPAFARFVGRSRGELTGRYLDEIMPGDHVTAHTSKFLRCLEAGERVEEQGRLQAATGPLWYASILTPVRDDEGRIRGLVGIFRDIADKMHMRAALQESEQRYREIAERSSDCIYLLEVTADRHFRALAANAAVETSFGIRREDVIGRLLEEIVPRPLADSLTARYAAVVESGITREEEVELDLPIGRHLHLRSTLVPMKDSAGAVRRLMVITRELPLSGEVSAVACGCGARDIAVRRVING